MGIGKNIGMARSNWLDSYHLGSGRVGSIFGGGALGRDFQRQKLIPSIDELKSVKRIGYDVLQQVFGEFQKLLSSGALPR